MLARMFARPANLLVMDEPTNDLDIETLEVLEDLLLEFPGTLLLVSHDRAFLNNLVTSTLVMDGQGNVGEFVGGYDDWLRQSQSLNDEKPIEAEKTRKPSASRNQDQPALGTARKPGNKEQRALEALRRELDEIPRLIENLEAEQHKLSTAMADPAFYQRDNAEISRDAARLKELEQALAQAYQRWEELEKL